MFCLAVRVEWGHGKDEPVLGDPGQADPVGVDVVSRCQAGQHQAAAVIREQVTVPVLRLVLHGGLTQALSDLKHENCR